MSRRHTNKDGRDKTTNATTIQTQEHTEVHEGNHFFIDYSVSDMSAMTSPDTMITLTFTTPNTTRWGHLRANAVCNSGARFRLIEGGTGGGASATGVKTIYNSNRNSNRVSTFLDVESTPTAGQMSYDATLVTGGTTLKDVYIGADGKGSFFIGGSTRGDEEIILKKNTQYQVSLYETDAVPGTISLTWYEHTNT